MRTDRASVGWDPCGTPGSEGTQLAERRIEGCSGDNYKMENKVFLQDDDLVKDSFEG